jgi:cell division transport system permease protein
MLYLEDNLPAEKLDSVIDTLKKNRAVLSVKYISKEDAMKELKGILKNSNYVFEGLGENPLPDTLEVKLRKESIGPDAAKKLAEEALKTKGIKEVEYGEKLVSALHTLKVGLNTIGSILIVILSTGIIFVCYSTVKILFYRKKEEIETFKLLGATKRFIRTPFIIEGAVIGTAGGAISLVGILTFYYIVILKLSITMPVFKTLLFPSYLFTLLPFMGMFLGISGAAIALGRLKY